MLAPYHGQALTTGHSTHPTHGDVHPCALLHNIGQASGVASIQNHCLRRHRCCSQHVHNADSAKQETLPI
jgi:hypothetical protein